MHHISQILSRATFLSKLEKFTRWTEIQVECEGFQLFVLLNSQM